jgi:hypothetical protein
MLLGVHAYDIPYHRLFEKIVFTPGRGAPHYPLLIKGLSEVPV